MEIDTAWRPEEGAVEITPHEPCSRAEACAQGRAPANPSQLFCSLVLSCLASSLSSVPVED